MMMITKTAEHWPQKDVGRTDGQCRTIACFVGRTKKVISSSGKDDLKEQGRRIRQRRSEKDDQKQRLCRQSGEKTQNHLGGERSAGTCSWWLEKAWTDGVDRTYNIFYRLTIFLPKIG